MSRNVSSSSSHITSLMAFLRSGRSRVTVTIAVRSLLTCSVSRWSDEDGWSEPGCGSDIGGTILATMGFNPHRQYRRSNADYLDGRRRGDRLRAPARRGPSSDDPSASRRAGRRAARAALSGRARLYLCPGCNQDVAPGVGHLVVVPELAPEDRRHWHHPCWEHRDAAGRPGRCAVTRRLDTAVTPAPVRHRSAAASPSTGRPSPMASTSPTSGRASVGSRSFSCTATRRPNASGGATSRRWPTPASR